MIQVACDYVCKLQRLPMPPGGLSRQLTYGAGTFVISVTCAGGAQDQLLLRNCHLCGRRPRPIASVQL